MSNVNLCRIFSLKLLINSINLCATLYDENENIRASEEVFNVEDMNGFKIKSQSFWLNCSITKVDRIIISGEVR